MKKKIRYTLILLIIIVICNVLKHKVSKEWFIASAHAQIYPSNFPLAYELNPDLEEACVNRMIIPGQLGKMKIIGDKLYVINDEPSLKIIDLTDPNTMIMITSLGSFQVNDPLTRYYNGNFKLTINNGEELKVTQNSSYNTTDFFLENNYLYFTFVLPKLSLWRVDLLDPNFTIEDIFSPLADAFFQTIPPYCPPHYCEEAPVEGFFTIDSQNKRLFCMGGLIHSNIYIWPFNISNANNIFLETTLALNGGKQIKNNKIYLVCPPKFSIVDIADLDNSKILSEKNLLNPEAFYSSNYSPTVIRDDKFMTLDDNFCYILVKDFSIPSACILIPYCYQLFYGLRESTHNLTIINVLDPNHPSFVNDDVKITFSYLSKQNQDSITPTEQYDNPYYVDKLYTYNGYVFIEGTINQKTRIYAIDTSTPTKPFLIGFINFPYKAKSMDFAHNCLYLATTDSTIYQYDLAKLLPAHPLPPSPESDQIEETQADQQEEPNPGESTSEETGSEETGSEETGSEQEEPPQSGGNQEEPQEIIENNSTDETIKKNKYIENSLEQPEKIIKPVPEDEVDSEDDEEVDSEDDEAGINDQEQSSPMPVTIRTPSWLWPFDWQTQAAFFPYWWLPSSTVEENPLPNYPKVNQSPYWSWGLPFSFDQYQTGYAPAYMPLSYLDVFMMSSLGQSLNLPEDYPKEVLPNLLYHVFGIKVK